MEDNVMDDAQLERIVIGAVKSTIASHGTIDKHLTSSASKRISGNIKSYVREYMKNELAKDVDDKFIVLSKEKFEQLKETIAKRDKTINHLLEKHGAWHGGKKNKDETDS